MQRSPHGRGDVAATPMSWGCDCGVAIRREGGRTSAIESFGAVTNTTSELGEGVLLLKVQHGGGAAMAIAEDDAP